jgi:excisionase family DNA binding protein
MSAQTQELLADRTPRLLDAEAASEFLGTTPRHIRYLYQMRQLAAVKVGKLVRFDPADLQAYADGHRVEAVR